MLTSSFSHCIVLSFIANCSTSFFSHCTWETRHHLETFWTSPPALVYSLVWKTCWGFRWLLGCAGPQWFRSCSRAALPSPSSSSHSAACTSSAGRVKTRRCRSRFSAAAKRIKWFRGSATRIFFRWSCLRVLISPLRSILLICSFLFSCSCRPCLTLRASICGTTAASCGKNGVNVQDSAHIQDICRKKDLPVSSVSPAVVLVAPSSGFFLPFCVFLWKHVSVIHYCSSSQRVFSFCKSTSKILLYNKTSFDPGMIKASMLSHHLANWFSKQYRHAVTALLTKYREVKTADLKICQFLRVLLITANPKSKVSNSRIS